MTRDQREKRDRTIGEFVAEDYRSAQVFESYDIDFCCGGQKTLFEACREKALDPAVLLQEIEAVKNEPGEGSEDFRTMALPALIDHIVHIHHAYLNENTGQIAAYARKVADVHGERHPEVIRIAAVFDQIKADMAGHLEEEEKVLFPAINRLSEAGKGGPPPADGDRAVIRDSLAVLHREHEDIGDAVHRIRSLANDYAIPEDVCNTFVVTYGKLREFEDDLHKHVHLENNILFPRAANL